MPLSRAQKVVLLHTWCYPVLQVTHIQLRELNCMFTNIFLLHCNFGIAFPSCVRVTLVLIRVFLHTGETEMYAHVVVAFSLVLVHMSVCPVSLVARPSGLLPHLGCPWMLSLGRFANGRLAFSLDAEAFALLLVQWLRLGVL